MGQDFSKGNGQKRIPDSFLKKFEKGKYKLDDNGDFVDKKSGKKFCEDSIPLNVKLYLMKRIEMDILAQGFKEIEYNKCYYLEMDKKIQKKEKVLVIMLPGLGKRFWGIGLLTPGVAVYVNYEKGTFLPFIDHCKKKGYDVLLLDQNSKKNILDPLKKIEDEKKFVMDQFNKFSSEYGKIAIFAHSFGGFHTMELVNKLDLKEFKRIKGIAFADSVHFGYQKRGVGNVIKNKEKLNRLNVICKNWVCSDDDLDEFVSKDGMNNILNFSAGTTKHPHTNYTAFKSMCKFIDENLNSNL